MRPVSHERCPHGHIRTKHLMLFGLSLGDFWFPLVLIVGCPALIAFLILYGG